MNNVIIILRDRSGVVRAVFRYHSVFEKAVGEVFFNEKNKVCKRITEDQKVEEANTSIFLWRDDVMVMDVGL